MSSSFINPLNFIKYFQEPKNTIFFKNRIAEVIICLFLLIQSVKLGNKERFDKEQIGIKEPFPVTNLPFAS